MGIGFSRSGKQNRRTRPTTHVASVSPSNAPPPRIPHTLGDLLQSSAQGRAGEINWGDKDNVNCYAWAADCAAPDGSKKPDPGEKSGSDARKDGRYDRAKLLAAAIADGMVRPTDLEENGIGSDEGDPPQPWPGYYLVALYISKNGADYHWYRQDPETGLWTHKPGPHGVRNYYGNFTVITDLASTDHDYGTANTNYEFVHYLFVPDGGIRIGAP
ncbi:hypothetical protein WMF20_27495 [Sorangium sp. So ce834]|uniref:hypothetical protein n=1 Tax=Sorangium sp. So ce834 TaxID=3133321 RepID=UPI003F6343AE